MHRHYGRMMRAISVTRMKTSSCSLWQPPVDIYETETELIVVAEVAGIEPDKIRVVADSNKLTVSGERRCGFNGINHVHRLEIEYGHFACHINLPASIDVDKTRSEIKNGFLIVHMPIVRHQGTVAINVR